MANTNFVDLVKEAKSHKYEFVLWPQRWQQYEPLINYNWITFAFCQDSVEKIPDKPGVYAFLIQPHIADNLDVSYLMYVGQTSRSLKKRFKEYLTEMNSNRGRPKIVTLLQMYQGYLYFSCITLDNNVSPHDVEEELLKALIPPANDQLPAEIRSVIKAF